MPSYTLGIDLGGTKILAITINGAGQIVARSKTKTKIELGPKGICEQIREVAEDSLKQAHTSLDNVTDIGIAIPAPVDPKTGDCLHAPNLGWKNQPIRKTFREIFQREVYIENDVNCGVLAEHHYGAGRGFNTVVGYFIGTGLGGGLIINGKLHRGINGCAGELGHEIVRYKGRCCGCGKRGCIEAYCSKIAFCKQFHKHINEKNEKSLISEINGKDFSRIKAKALAEAYGKNDYLTCKIVKKGFEMLGVAVANIAAILAPECVVFGGGVIEELKDEMFPIIKKSFAKHLFALDPEDIQLKLSELGDDAVPLGSALIAKRKANV